MIGKRASLVVNFHREQRIGFKTIRFVQAVVERLRQSEIILNCCFVLDRPDSLTRSGIRRWADALAGSEVLEVDFGNLGAARSAGIAHTNEDIVFFLDGDDFVTFNWFARALRFFAEAGAEGDRLIAHTQYFVGFDREQFVRLGLDSRDGRFDPLALATDWYFCNNLACHRSVFDAVPIEPYDHAGGFGAEDWHWSCETIARGFSHVAIPGTAYFYRGKPADLSLGAKPELLPRPSSLFTGEWMSSHATETAADTETALPALGDEFFDAADQLVEFDYGISYLRSARIAPEKLLYFKPVTPGIVGVTLLGLLASQAGDGPVDVVYGDLDRIPLGIPTIEKIVARVLNLDASSPSSRTVYFLEGRGAGDHSANSQNVVLLDELRAAGLSDIHIARLIARFFVQSSGVRVFNFVSPRKRSLAMFHIAAKRHTLVSWDNVVLEFGFDYFSCTGSEIIDLQDAGVEARNICIFAKTAREMAEQTGIKILYSASLESIYGGCESRLLATRVEEVRSSAFVAFEKTPQTAAFSQIRISGGDKLILDDGRAEMGDRGFAYLVLGGAQPTAETMRVMAAAECRRGPCISIPAMVVQRRSGGNLFIRPNVERMNEAIAKGLLPAGLFDVPLAGFDVKTVERIWQQYRSVPGEGVSLSRFLSSYFAEPGLRFTSMGHDTVVSCGERDMQCLDAAVVARRTTAARARSQTSDSP